MVCCPPSDDFLNVKFTSENDIMHVKQKNIVNITTLITGVSFTSEGCPSCTSLSLRNCCHATKEICVH